MGAEAPEAKGRKKREREGVTSWAFTFSVLALAERQSSEIRATEWKLPGRVRVGGGGRGSPLSSQDSDWKELREWTSDMLPRVL